MAEDPARTVNARPARARPVEEPAPAATRIVDEGEIGHGGTASVHKIHTP